LDAALDELLAGKSTEEIVGPGGVLKELTKALLERAMGAELSNHLGYEKHDSGGRGSGNNRNGKSRKTVQGDFGAVEIEVPRDRNGSFEPKILPKHERRFQGFDDKILSMYARGMTTRDIQAHLEEIYGVEVSPSLISEVTDAVVEEVRAWQHRPLELACIEDRDGGGFFERKPLCPGLSAIFARCSGFLSEHLSLNAQPRTNGRRFSVLGTPCG